MDMTKGTHTPSGLGWRAENGDARMVGKYSLRMRATIFGISWLLSWGVIFLFVWSIF